MMIYQVKLIDALTRASSLFQILDPFASKYNNNILFRVNAAPVCQSVLSPTVVLLFVAHFLI